MKALNSPHRKPSVVFPRIGKFTHAALVLALLTLVSALAPAVRAETLKIGVVTFLSGPAAGPFGVPAANAASMIVEALNVGTVPAPYDTPGIKGANLEMILIDEAGGTTKQVTEFRNLVQRRGVDAVVGYISSGSCLGVAPIAEELKTLTVFFDCGTPRIFEERDYRYVFRTAAHAAMDGIAAARYVLDRAPDIKRHAGINQNYAWGQDSWRDYALTMDALNPGMEVATEQWPKLFAGQYNAEISALLISGAEAIHTSLWGGDLEAFINQAGARGLHDTATLVLSTGETMMYLLGDRMPEGVVIGGRGPYGVFADDTPLNQWFREGFDAAYGTPPTYPAYQMAQALLGLKAAYEKAAGGDSLPTTDAVIDAFEYLTFEGLGTTVDMAIGGGHQAITSTAYGTFMRNPETGAPTIVDVIRYPAACVNPPDGTDSVAWISDGMAGATCD